MTEPTRARENAIRDAAESPLQVAARDGASGAEEPSARVTAPESGKALSLRARIVRTALRRPKTLEQAVSFVHLLGDPRAPG